MSDACIAPKYYIIIIIIQWGLGLFTDRLHQVLQLFMLLIWPRLFIFTTIDI